MIPARRIPLMVVSTLLAVAACDQPVTSPDTEVVPTYAARSSRGSEQVEVASFLTQQVDELNAALAAQGSTIRLDYPWLFTVGGGTDPYARLRTGSRWTTPEPTYILDESDYTTTVPAAAVDAALVAAYDTWNGIPNSALHAVRVGDPGTNMDVLDGTYDQDGNCLTIYDISSPNLDLNLGEVFPEAHIVVGGWIPETYFSQCLENEDILGVTWSFSDVDSDGDQYRDRLYVEQFYNPRFAWVTSGSQYLNYESGVDIQTVAAHEDGHAHGLGHFGGPVRNQPFKLQPNGKVFNPEAIMNPGYLYGEKRVPYATDIAGMKTMYVGY